MVDIMVSEDFTEIDGRIMILLQTINLYICVKRLKRLSIQAEY